MVSCFYSILLYILFRFNPFHGAFNSFPGIFEKLSFFASSTLRGTLVPLGIGFKVVLCGVVGSAVVVMVICGAADSVGLRGSILNGDNGSSWFVLSSAWFRLASCGETCCCS